MAIRAKYVHTNLVAHDWRRLVRFYQDVFGCLPVGAERNYRGEWVGRITTLPEARIEGVHLRVPGHGDDGPTLEIFQFHPETERPPTALNRPGFAHIAFHVDDVAAARREVLAAGGRDFGQMHTMNVPGAGTITLIYMTDPEGNVVELQRWE